MTHDVVVVGGFGRAGLPLAISLASKGKTVCALDINAKALDVIAAGTMPFLERDAEPLLREALGKGTLRLSLDPAELSRTEVIVLIVGTPVDRHLNPEFEALRSVLESYLPFLRDGQLLVLRSTIYPGISEKVRAWLHESGKRVEVAFCPERIAEGDAIRELTQLPQIVSSFTPDGVRRASELFRALTAQVLEVTPIEAELAKLFSNVWRYVKFAAANQFFMIANDHGADFYRIHHAMTHDYPRCRDLPTPGFAAGPCLFKDAMQLAAFNNNSFYLGHAAMLVNEGLPNYVVGRIKQRVELRDKTVGILGMAFKANSDDTRESLAFKLKKILLFEAKDVLCSDPRVRDASFVGAEELLQRCDVVIVAAPHAEYRELALPEGKLLVDVWNLAGNGFVL